MVGKRHSANTVAIKRGRGDQLADGPFLPRSKLQRGREGEQQTGRYKDCWVARFCGHCSPGPPFSLFELRSWAGKWAATPRTWSPLARPSGAAAACFGGPATHKAFFAALFHPLLSPPPQPAVGRERVMSTPTTVVADGCCRSQSCRRPSNIKRSHDQVTRRGLAEPVLQADPNPRVRAHARRGNDAR